jgi:hypothetical protein
MIALVAHGYLTLIAWGDHGYSGFFPPFAMSNTTQIFSDLVIALTLVNVWVYLDLRRRGQSLYWFVLHLVGTAAAGSNAPLLYLLIRSNSAEASYRTQKELSNG